MTTVNNNDLLDDLPDELTEQELSDLEYKDPYAYHMRSESHYNKAPIEIDPETGWRYTYREIGMTRNAKDEDKKLMKVYLEPVPHVVVDQDIKMRGWYKAKHEPAAVRPRPCFTDALLTQPYGGFCHVGCGFCYINNGVRGYRGQGIATVDPNYGEKITKQLRGMRKAAAVYMSSFIDPFIELEDHYHNTQKCAEAADAVGLPMFFLTRKQIPGWAYDLVAKNKYSYMQMSINTSNSADWRKLSPRALSLEAMIDQVRECKRRGIYVSIQVNPIVAGVVSNEDIVALIHMLGQAGADHLIFKFVEIVYPSAPAMVMNMEKRFGDRALKFKDLFTQNIGGVKTIAEEYRKAALDIYSRECKKAGVTMSLCYEYEYDRNPETGAILSHTGKSMAPRYTTSDQCHGHRVPIFTRNSADEMFVPMEECPPTGCLYCGEKFGGEDKVPCGNPELAAAIAWEPKHLKTPGRGDPNIIIRG